MVTEQEFFAYEDVRQSGVINMYDIKQGMELSGLSRDKYAEVMKNYTELKEKYMGENK
jgi:hypothetical protein